MPDPDFYPITSDDLSCYPSPGPAFATFGEVMVRDTPADLERPERTRLVHLSMAGSEYTLTMGLQRLGIPSSFVTGCRTTRTAGRCATSPARPLGGAKR